MRTRVVVTMLGVFGLVAAQGFTGVSAADGTNFVSRCRYSHTLSDDPIVKPGQPGASHSHDFFGNTTTNASSTYDSLRAGSTTCRAAADTAAYWTPTLSVNGTSVKPVFAQIYYLPGRKDPRTIQAFPAGLRIVAGDSHATAAQPMSVTTWSCSNESTPPSSDVPASCPSGTHLVLHVRFPDCWDGTNLDSADHRSHMTYGFHRCPAADPVPVPRLSVNIHYPVTSGNGVSLSSGGTFSGHADFFNAWNQQALERFVRECLNARRHCGPVR